MRKLFTFLFAALMSVGMSWAAKPTMIVNPVQIDDFYYNLDADNQTAEVTYQELWSENNYSSLTSADIPSSVTYNNQTYSVTSIGGSAFYGCTALTSVTIPNSVTSIGDRAFRSCSGLASVTIGNGVTSIDEMAFLFCSSLASVTVNATTPPTLGSSAFDGTAAALKIYVPAESVDDYKTAWAAYEDKIESIAGGDEPAGDEITVTWTSADIPSTGEGKSFTKDGVTITCTGGIDWHYKDFYGPATFTTDLGNFTKIEVTADICDISGDGWSGSTWTGNAASVSFEGGMYTISSIVFTIEPASTPEPAEDVNITPNADPDHAGVYYSTFYDSAKKYELPAGVEAYVADLSGANLLLTKIAEAGEVIPANVAVILKSTVTPFTLTVSDADAVTFTATNDLQGSDTQIATPANCYVLAGTDGVVGFYHYTAANLNAHKAYVVYSGSNQAPRRMPFIFDQATGVENVQGDKVQSTKVLRDGQLIIIRNGVEYNANGMMVK